MTQAEHCDAFVARWNGKKIDEDGYYGTQCWDVAARYAREEYGCPSFPTGSGGAEGVYRIFSTPIGNYFDKIANTPDPNQIPIKGDIVVWTNKVSPPWGHIAVVISATPQGMVVFEQNGGIDPNGDGIADGVSYTINRGYTNVAGWLRPKESNVDRKIDGSGDDVAMLRIAHSEAGGWDLHKTHAGEYDKLFVDTYKGRTVRDLLWAQWNNGGAWRDLRMKALDFFAKNKTIGDQLTAANAQIAKLTGLIDELNKRPTSQEVDELKKAASEAATKAMQAQAELEKIKAENAEADKQTKGFFRALWRFITGKEA